MSIRVLVTGSAGQLGQAIRKVSSDYDCDCIFTDIAPGDGILSLDVTDADEVTRMIDAHDVDVIVNCAAYTNVDKAEEEETEAERLNSYAPAVLASAAREKNVLLIHISTDYVFDGHAWSPYSEDDRPSPQTAYGRSKLAGEKAVVDSGCRHVIIRSAWMFSCYGHNFFNRMVELTAEKPHLKVVYDQVGTPTYAPDLADAIFRIICSGRTDIEGIYNYTNEGLCSWYDFAKAICDSVGHLCDIRPCRTSEYASSADRPHYSVLDKSKIKTVFNLEIPHWTDSLRVCASVRENDDINNQ